MQETNKIKERSSVRGFGAKLKAEREAREIALEEISRVTRISLHLLRSMEDDNWDDLPGGIFTRNFIRLYARHLGLDAEKLVDEFVQFIEIKHKAELSEKKEDGGFKDSGNDEQNYTWMYITLVVTVILLITGFILVNSFSGSDNAPDQEMSESTNPDEGATRNQTQTSSNAQGDDGVILTEKEESGLRIEMTETSRSSTWFQWRADGQLKSPPDGENLLLNQPRTFNADENVWFNLSRLQSITLHINGEERQWQDFNPRPQTNDDGAIISYIVEIKLSDLE